MSATRNLVKTNVDPPSAADKDAKNDPNSRFLKNILFLYMSDFLNQLK